MLSTSNDASPGLVMIDVGAPLEESLRRLQAQLAHVEILARQESSTQRTRYEAAPSSAAKLSEERASTAEVTTALRQRVAHKLRRLSEEQHTNLCLARTCLPDADLAAVVPSTPSPFASHNSQGHPTWEVVAPSAPSPQHAGGEEEEDDLFGWVTTASPSADAPAPPAAATTKPAATPQTDAIHAAAAHTPSEEDVLRRVAEALADVVEARYRHAGELEDTQQLLLQAQECIHDVCGTKANTSNSTNAGNVLNSASGSTRDNIRALLSYRPSHVIASEAEKEVWQRAWQTVLPSSAAAADAVAGLELKVGDAVEMIDVAVLAHVNAQRRATLQQRWSALQRRYVGLVEQLNLRFAQAALQIEEMERHH